MSTSTVPTTRPHAAYTPAAARAAAVPWYIVATVVAATSIVIGPVWDISWHRTIGRDTFFSPPHLAIYLGGVLGGLSAAYLILRTTFRGTDAERAAAVRIWGFRGPLGAWVSAWGAAAMLTSAPFDDWWHNAYGLDVEILSPPHVVLALGILGIVLGALLQVLAAQNRAATPTEERAYGAMYVYVSGLMLVIATTMALDYNITIRQHSSIFYRVTCATLPFLLFAAARASRLRWPATAAAASYVLVTAAMVWILPLFPGEPKLGPILTRVTHMVPPPFPLLLVVPAFAADLVMRRTGQGRDWAAALGVGAVFFTVLLATQWVFSIFLLSKSPLADGWLFAGRAIDYATPSTSFMARGAFYPGDATEGAMRTGMLVALALSVLSTRVGLWWGNWMRRVQR